MTSVLIYTRLSTDDQNGATDRQEAACRAYAVAREWDVAGVLTDTDASAYRGTHHPAAVSVAKRQDTGVAYRLGTHPRPPGIMTFEITWGTDD